MDRTNRNTALASALVEELSRCGVEHACVSPGSRSAPLALALWKEPGIRVWSHVDERCGGFFALGIAQATGIPAVVLTTSGTAGANLHPAVAEASEARVPLIVITADRPPELRGRGAGQTIDQLKLYGSSVRWFCEVGAQNADDTGLLHFRSIAVRAWAEAQGTTPGPVHLNVALREPLAPLAMSDDLVAEDPLALEGRAEGPLTAVRSGTRTTSPDLLATLVALIADQREGVIIVGRQRDPSLADSVTALARLAGYPILAEPTSQLRAGDHDLASVIAPYDAILRSPPPGLRPEIVLRFGDMVTSKATREWLAANRDCRQLVIAEHDGWNEPSSRAEAMLRIDPTSLCRSLAASLEPRDETQWLDRWRSAARAADEAIDTCLGSLDELLEPRIHRQLAGLLPPASTVYVASSMPVRDLETFFPKAAKRIRFLANRGANGIDGLVSSGLGAAAAGSGRTFILTGDLGLYHDMNGLLAMKRHGIEATIIVLNNGGGGIFDFLPIAEFEHGYEELFATPTGLDLARVAELYGLRFSRIGAYAELEDAISLPGLVEVPLERQRNVALHREIFERVAEATAARNR